MSIHPLRTLRMSGNFILFDRLNASKLRILTTDQYVLPPSYINVIDSFYLQQIMKGWGMQK
jgi:hypothetical protein